MAQGQAGQEVAESGVAGAREADTGMLGPWLLGELAKQYDPADVARIVAGSTRRCVSLRANALKTCAASVAAALDEAGIAYEKPAWSPDAFLLPQAREHLLRELGIYERGEVYLQSLSSQLPALILAPRAGADVLDMCAAPGGKTTQMAALTGGAACITACEMHAPRAEKLEHNLRLQGAGNVNVMRTDARRLDDFFSFDQILLDAPCSGSGTLDKADARGCARVTPELAAKCSKSQRALLAKALRLLKPGGTMVYSTCSVLAQENEEAVRWALSQGKVKARLVPIGTGGARPSETSAAGGGNGASGAGAAGGTGGAGEGNRASRAGGLDLTQVPTLPTSLPGTLLVCPTNSYEGFFVAKLQRMA